MLRAIDGGLDGLLVMGQNPAVGSIHSGLQRRALASMKWLVVRDLADLETAHFWRDSPEIRSGEHKTEEIATEVFLMPCAGHVEKEGHFTNTQRLLQWRDKALDPPGDARSELHFAYHLGKRIKAHYADSERERDWPIRNLTWDYPEHGPEREPSADAVLREINGYDLTKGELVNGFAQLKADGSTACGCWIYSGCYANGVNQTRRRNAGDLDAPGGWVSPEWGWAWPMNRRILYNRASADPDGKPWSERKKYVWWDEEQEKWTGYDVPDMPPGHRPDHVPPPGAEGMDALPGDSPFIMMPDGKAWLFNPSGLLDAPLPTHYEPLESPLPNELYPNVGSNPVGVTFDRPENPLAEPGDDDYPHIASTFRLTEHHTAGPMSRNLPWLAELQPEMFAEIDPVLAASAGIEDGGWMVVETARAEIEAIAKVTNRMRPLRLGERVVHQVCLPWHWGTYTTNEQGSTGDSVNDLVAISGDPNVTIQESKAFRCRVRAGRREERDDGEAGARGRRRASATLTTPSSRTACRHSAEHLPLWRRQPGDLRCPRRSPKSRSASRRPGAWASSRTRPCASAARRARSPASSGTTCPPTARPTRASRASRSTTRRRLSASTWRHVRFVETVKPIAGGGARRLDRGEGGRLPGGRGRERGVAGPLGVPVRRLQALHERRLPRRLPDGCAHPDGVRNGHRAVRHLQRLRLLRRLLPVRRDRPRPLRRPGREVHALLRPPPGRPRTGVREGLPDRLDPVRALRGAGGDGEEARGRAA